MENDLISFCVFYKTKVEGLYLVSERHPYKAHGIWEFRTEKFISCRWKLEKPETLGLIYGTLLDCPSLLPPNKYSRFLRLWTHVKKAAGGS